MAPILGELRDGRPPTVFDLSVGSALPHAEDDGADLAVFSEHLLQQMQQARVSVGIGRYHEARLLYTAGQFKVQTD